LAKEATNKKSVISYIFSLAQELTYKRRN